MALHLCIPNNLLFENIYSNSNIIWKRNIISVALAKFPYKTS